MSVKPTDSAAPLADALRQLADAAALVADHLDNTRPLARTARQRKE